MEYAHLSPESLSETLKTETAALHGETESIELSALMMSDELTIDKYTEYLTRLYPVHAAFEATVFPLLSGIFQDLDKREKSALLRNDITDTTTVYNGAAGQLANESLPFLAGYMYVLEGSVLGGRHLVKNAEKVLGEAVSGRTAYFRVYGDEIGRMWKLFISDLNQYGSTFSAAELKESVNGAQRAFRDVATALQTPATAYEGHC